MYTVTVQWTYVGDMDHINTRSMFYTIFVYLKVIVFVKYKPV
jgi:hypothetical protein